MPLTVFKQNKKQVSALLNVFLSSLVVKPYSGAGVPLPIFPTLAQTRPSRSQKPSVVMTSIESKVLMSCEIHIPEPPSSHIQTNAHVHTFTLMDTSV